MKTEDKMESNPKWFVIEAGHEYDCSDLIAAFASREDAESVIEHIIMPPLRYTNRETVRFKILGSYYDYYEIIDLREYVFGEVNHESGCHKI
jgi:hypothetical protein